MNKVCIACSQTFEAVHFNNKYCPDCSLTRAKQCRDCGKIIVVDKFSKVVLCPQCKENSLKNHMRLYDRFIFCKKCGKELGQFKGKGSKSQNKLVICKDCKENRFSFIEQKTVCKDCEKEISVKLVKSCYQTRSTVFKRCKACVSKLISERMKKNNPMKKQEVVNKVHKTLKVKGYQAINPTTGKGWAYKGFRDLRSCVADRLYDVWKLPILQRDNFTCVMCGAKKLLHVHHIKPLRAIINDVLVSYNIELSSLRTINATTLSNFDVIVNESVLAHKLEYGITVCKVCHSVIDPYFKIKKEENTDE